jgi:hypothetical protein
MNCDACVGVEAEHHQCDQCVQDDIAAERALRAKLTKAETTLARQRAEIRRLRGVLLKIAVGPHGIDQYGHCSYRRAAAEALTKRRAKR